MRPWERGERSFESAESAAQCGARKLTAEFRTGNQHPFAQRRVHHDEPTRARLAIFRRDFNQIFKDMLGQKFFRFNRPESAEINWCDVSNQVWKLRLTFPEKLFDILNGMNAGRFHVNADWL